MEQECVQFGYLLTDSYDIMTLWLYSETNWQSCWCRFEKERKHSFTWWKRSFAFSPVILYLITTDKTIFDVWTKTYGQAVLFFFFFSFVCMKRRQLCYQRLFRPVFCGSWLSSSCLLIGSVWLLHHIGGERGSCSCNIVFTLRLK